MSAARPFEPISPRPSLKVDLERARAELDLDSRLDRIRADACLRGVWFRMIADAVSHAGAGTVAAFQHLAPASSRWFFKLYPLADYLEEMAIAVALLFPDDARRGVETIWREAPKYSGFLHPNTFIRLLRPEPVEPMRWLVKNHDHFANFGAFRLEERGRGHAVMHLQDEYIWIDAAHKGDCEGVLDACGVDGEVKVELDDDFNGRLIVRWEPRQA
jgi:uncharacterized protein (TIGR02265 family)